MAQTQTSTAPSPTLGSVPTNGNGSRRTSIVNDRICRIATYVEPDVADIIEAEAKQAGDTVSGWLRTVILNSLIDQGAISPDLLRRLATR